MRKNSLKIYTLYVFKKIVFIFVTMWVVATFTFILMHCLPGDPFTKDRAISPNILENLNTRYGLNKPLIEQYKVYMGKLLTGDLGISMVYKNKSVNSVIKRAFPVSLDLGIRAGIIAIFVGIFLGMLAACYKNRIVDRLTLIVVMTGMSVPGFIIGTIFQYFLCYKLSDFIMSITGSDYRLFPVTGWQGFRYTIVPALSLAVCAMGMIARMMRTGMIEALGSNYITAAKARGLSIQEILTRHAIRNAVLPVVSVLGPLMTSIVLGSFVIENIFSIPGLGQYFVSSIQAKDYTMILGLSVFTVLVVVVMNTLTDILYAIIDPRVRILKEQ